MLRFLVIQMSTAKLHLSAFKLATAIEEKLEDKKTDGNFFKNSVKNIKEVINLL